MTTNEFGKYPEIEWSIDRSQGACIEDFGEIKTYPATGESADGRNWCASADVMYGDYTEIDCDSIEEV